jgi:hypothetical protein
MRRQRGMVLLPVTLALAIVGTLAYAMTRDGAMSASAVDAQYDTDRARYLAEAGVNLLKWRNEQSSCNSAQGFSSPFTGLEGGTISSSSVTNKKPILAMTLTATTDRGTVNKVVLDEKTGVVLHDLSKKTEITISAQNGSDGFIRADPLTGNTTLAYLETTDDKAHGLIKFDLGPDRTGAMVTEATLRLYLGSVQSTQAGALGVHRMLRAWPFLMNWTNGWTNPGGDFAPLPSNLYATPLAAGTAYTTRIDGLVQDWTTLPPTNLGLLLKPAGLVAARFNSFEAAANQPQLFLRYYPLCK